MDALVKEVPLFGGNFAPIAPDGTQRIVPDENLDFSISAMIANDDVRLDSPIDPADADQASEMKGLSWFGFETTYYDHDDGAISNSGEASDREGEFRFQVEDVRVDDALDNTTGSFGHFSQIVWADTAGTPPDGYVGRGDGETLVPDDNVLAFDFTDGDDRPAQGHDFDQVIYGTNGDDVLVGGGGSDLIFGFYGNDLLHGGGGDDVVVGGWGYNTVYGDQGDDEVVGGYDNDELFGGLGNDDLFGEDGNDELFGNEDHDILFGGAGNDELFGGEGHDVLVGGLGLDELTGGSGIDIFRWGGNWDGGKDTVTDFEIDVDQFQFIAANGQSSFFDTNPGDSISDVLTALDNGNDTELLANTATDGWVVIANLENTDHDAIQQRIDDGSILYGYGEAVFDTVDVFLA